MKGTYISQKLDQNNLRIKQSLRFTLFKFIFIILNLSFILNKYIKYWI